MMLVRDLVPDNRLDEPLCHRHLRGSKDLQNAAGFHDLSALHDRYLVADHLDDLHLMGDEKDRDTHFTVDLL